MPHEVKHLRHNHGLFLQADGYMDTEQCYTCSNTIAMVWISGIRVWLHGSKFARSVGVAHGVVNVCCECLLCSICVSSRDTLVCSVCVANVFHFWFCKLCFHIGVQSMLLVMCVFLLKV